MGRVQSGVSCIPNASRERTVGVPPDHVCSRGTCRHRRVLVLVDRAPLKSEAADAKMRVTMLLLREIANERDLGINTVSEKLDDSNRQVAGVSGMTVLAGPTECTATSSTARSSRGSSTRQERRHDATAPRSTHQATRAVGEVSSSGSSGEVRRPRCCRCQSGNTWWGSKLRDRPGRMQRRSIRRRRSPTSARRGCRWRCTQSVPRVRAIR